MATANPFRFSTKFQDDESGLLYYGYRYYDPGIGRWNSRDPIAENGGINLFTFLRNRAPNSIDGDGLVELPRVPQIPSFPWPYPIRLPQMPRLPRLKLPTLPSLIPRCVVDCAKYGTAGKDAKNTFLELEKKYSCTCNGKEVSLADYDGCENGDENNNWQVAHRIWGCYAKKYGVPRACVLAGNVAWEWAEVAFHDEIKKRGGWKGWRSDTINDMAAVIEGYDSGASDCDRAFIPKDCHLKTEKQP